MIKAHEIINDAKELRKLSHQIQGVEITAYQAMDIAIKIQQANVLASLVGNAIVSNAQDALKKA